MSNLYPLLGVFVIGLVVGRLEHLALPTVLRLRDRTRPYRWPWIELLLAGLFVALHLDGASSGSEARGSEYLLVALLVMTVATDFHSKLIPNRITYPGTAVGLFLAMVFPETVQNRLGQGSLLLPYLPEWLQPANGLLIAALGAVVGFSVLEGFRRVVAIVTRLEAMGMGDAKLLMMVGAFTGPIAAVLVVLPACLIGTALGLIHRLRTGLPHFPFGPALAAGAVVVLLGERAILVLLHRMSLTVVRLPLPWVLGFQLLLLGVVTLLLVRMRRRAQRYRAVLEEDFRRIDEHRLSDGDEASEPAAEES